MGAEFVVSVVVAAFAHEVEIEFGEQIGEGVSVVKLEGRAFVGATEEFVAGRRGRIRLLGGEDGFEESFGAKFGGFHEHGRRDGELVDGDAAQGDAGSLGPGKKKADGPALAGAVRAEDGEGIGITAGENRVNAAGLVGVAGGLGWVGHDAFCVRTDREGWPLRE